MYIVAFSALTQALDKIIELQEFWIEIRRGKGTWESGPIRINEKLETLMLECESFVKKAVNANSERKEKTIDGELEYVGTVSHECADALNYMYGIRREFVKSKLKNYVDESVISKLVIMSDEILEIILSIDDLWRGQCRRHKKTV